jgi:hypothetical protein
MIEHNKRVDEGYYANKEDFPNSHPLHSTKYTQEEIDECMVEYHPAWSPCFHKDDKNLFFIDLHY